MLEAAPDRIPRREDGWSKALDMAVLVAGARADVVGGTHPNSGVVVAPEHEDDAQSRPLVLGQPDGWRPEVGEDGLEESASIVASRP